MDPTATPQITELHPAVEGDGLAISGWFATWDQDSQAEAFVSHAFDKALPRYLATNPIVLHMHKKNEPPVGKVLDAYIDPKRGLYGTILLPRPEVGTKAMEVYSAVTNGLLKSFSVGGWWKRFQDAAGNTKLICDRLLEISLAGPNVNENCVADGAVARVQGMKAIGDDWLPLDEYDRRCRKTQERLLCKKAERQLALVDLKLTVAEILQAI